MNFAKLLIPTTINFQGNGIFFNLQKMKISIILGLIFIFSCSKKPEDTFGPFCCSLGPSQSHQRIFISVVDEFGDDLLDPANPKGIKIDDITVLSVIDGKEKSFTYMKYISNDFTVSVQENRKYLLTVAINIWNSEYEDSPTKEKTDTLRLETLTILSWNQKNRDTLRAEIERTYKSVKVKNIWINGQLIWQQNNDYVWGKPFFTMTKKSLQADRTTH